ncbi:MAG: plasmid pRiA4b ORF-3 family protein [Treponema sp.]|nr:plasmid pRiA4b ORF-3 family protein [Treponema sp.]
MSLAMTENQEEALYDFLDNAGGAFELVDAVFFIRMIEPNNINRLPAEVEAFINFRNLAFPIGKERWVSRRGFFEPLSFVISPTRLELVNGILIPGHRCVPFANANLFPHEYTFFWQGTPVPFTTTEGPPEEFYPFYSILGEEYAPQYVARDNSENEQAFNSDPYEDPPEVSIKTLDMRNIYREASFVPGDRFVVRTLDWKEGSFELEKVGKDVWAQADLDSWFLAAERGFEESFGLLGPGSCTEEQIAYAYWYGDTRMREIPAYSLEEYLFEKTNKIEPCPYGIETRFWFAGREIPDLKSLNAAATRPDRTPMEEIFHKHKVPVSEYVIHSYIRDYLYRGDNDVSLIIKRLIPGMGSESGDRKFLVNFIENVLEDARELYTAFTDRAMGPIRQRAGELHTAVIELVVRLGRGDIDTSWLPRHTFIILSQIQNHTANVMEDLDSDTPPLEAELEALDSSLDSMIETYEDVKELIEEALDAFRRNKLAVVRSGDNSNMVAERLLQLTIGGIDVWRRLIVPENCTLGEFHQIIKTIFHWQNEKFRFVAEKELAADTRILDLELAGIIELLYEYETKWTVRIMLLSRQETPGNKPVRCVAGAGAAPPEFIEGPVRFKRVLSSLECGNEMERHCARQELGPDFIPGDFDLEACNRSLSEFIMGR